MIARKGPLPKQYLDVIDKYYQDKTMLKNGPDGESEDAADERQYQYMKSKNKLNGIYGMSAQDPIRESIQFIDGDCIKQTRKNDRRLKKHISLISGEYTRLLGRAMRCTRRYRSRETTLYIMILTVLKQMRLLI